MKMMDIVAKCGALKFKLKFTKKNHVYWIFLRKIVEKNFQLTWFCAAKAMQ
jgi:hypothetical protein